MESRRTGSIVIALAVIALLVAHQDNWLWKNDHLVMGIIPIGLFYHACLSIAATLTWWLATKCAWPEEEITGSTSKHDADTQTRS